MAYDAEKDKVVKNFGEVQVEDKMFTIGIYQYNGGEKKIGIQRKFTKRDGSVSYGPMGRLTRYEAIAIREVFITTLSDLETW